MSVLGPNVQSLSEQIPGILLIPAGSLKDAVGLNIGLNMFLTSKANSRTQETKHPWRRISVLRTLANGLEHSERVGDGILRSLGPKGHGNHHMSL